MIISILCAATILVDTNPTSETDWRMAGRHWGHPLVGVAIITLLCIVAVNRDPVLRPCQLPLLGCEHHVCIAMIQNNVNSRPTRLFRLGRNNEPYAGQLVFYVTTSSLSNSCGGRSA